MQVRSLSVGSVVVAFLLVSLASAQSVTYKGVEFPLGDKSFADKLISYDPVIQNDRPSEKYRHSENILGPPDYTTSSTGHNAHCSLGNGGSVTVEFSDNALVNGEGEDLWVFEVGTAVEETFVEISVNARDWVSIGRIEGGKRGIDLEERLTGAALQAEYRYVRLRDNPDADRDSGTSAGADMDAVGAIHSVAAPPPPPIDDPGEDRPFPPGPQPGENAIVAEGEIEALEAWDDGGQGCYAGINLGGTIIGPVRWFWSTERNIQTLLETALAGRGDLTIRATKAARPRGAPEPLTASPDDWLTAGPREWYRLEQVAITK